MDTIKPIADAGLDTLICSGSSTNIGGAANGGTTYSWTPSTGLSSATVANPVASPTFTTGF